MTPVEPKESGDPGARDLSALRGIGPIDAPPEVIARVRRQARAELEAVREGDWLSRASRAWNRVGLPAALTVMVVGYLSWAVGVASALYQ